MATTPTISLALFLLVLAGEAYSFLFKSRAVITLSGVIITRKKFFVYTKINIFLLLFILVGMQENEYLKLLGEISLILMLSSAYIHNLRSFILAGMLPVSIYIGMITFDHALVTVAGFFLVLALVNKAYKEKPNQ